MSNTPDQVLNLVVTNIDVYQIDLAWTEPYDNGFPITGYQIERKSHGSWTVIVSDTANTNTSYSNTGLDADTTYQYRVSAINAAGTGNASDSVSATTLGTPTSPTIPLELTSTPGDGAVLLFWKEPLSDGGDAIFDYVIEYSPDNGNSWNVFDDGISVNTQSTVTELENYRSYLFRVSAKNTIGQGPYAQISSIPIATTGSSASDARQPPEILGIGFYKIITQNISDVYSKFLLGTEFDSGGFKQFVPYSTLSDQIDKENFGGFEKYEKVGQYVYLKDENVFPTLFSQVGKPLQLQIRLEDKYLGTKIEHFGLYLNSEQTKKLSESDVQILWNKGKSLDVIDDNNLLSKVNFNTSLEDGWFWAIIDLQFEKEVQESDITIETWNEIKRPKIKTIKDAIEISTFQHSPKIERASLRVDVDMSHDTSNPVCKVYSACFTPYNAKVLEGGVVSWINNDSFMHDIESGTPGNSDNRFDMHIFPGETGQKKFEHAGVYQYYCSMHPWATGIVTVIPKNADDKKIEFDETKPALLIASETSQGSIMIENHDTVTLPNHDPRIIISGHIQEKKGSQPLKIILTKPDGSSEKITTSTNDRGYYHIPAILDKKLEDGTYRITTFYKNAEIASIEFDLNEHIQGFHGKLPSMIEQLETKINTYYNNEMSLSEFESWLKDMTFNSRFIEFLVQKLSIF